MILHSLRLHGFRAHEDTRVTFAPKVNLLHGPNGSGKTNILEAVHYLCLTKSFLTSQDTYVLRQGSPYFEIEGHFEGERRPELRVRLAYVPAEGKRVFVNGAPLERLADLVGTLPVVVYSPEDHALTAGGPDERRRFLNNILSQARPVYLDDVLKYRRAVKQRNELLSQYRRRRSAPPRELMEPWDAELIALGTRIVTARHRFLQAFSAYLHRAYQMVEEVAEEPHVTYDTVAQLEPADEAAQIEEKFRTALDRVARREFDRGVTLIGPHRDELVFRLNELEVRRYASQGQHRTFGMALKIAKYFYLHEALGERPILLLDDVFDHLDAYRSEAFLQLVQTDVVQQSLITATGTSRFTTAVPFEAEAHRTIRVAAGAVEADAASEM